MNIQPSIHPFLISPFVLLFILLFVHTIICSLNRNVVCRNRVAVCDVIGSRQPHLTKSPLDRLSRH